MEYAWAPTQKIAGFINSMYELKNCGGTYVDIYASPSQRKSPMPSLGRVLVYNANIATTIYDPNPQWREPYHQAQDGADMLAHRLELGTSLNSEDTAELTERASTAVQQSKLALTLLDRMPSTRRNGDVRQKLTQGMQAIQGAASLLDEGTIRDYCDNFQALFPYVFAELAPWPMHGCFHRVYERTSHGLSNLHFDAKKTDPELAVCYGKLQKAYYEMDKYVSSRAREPSIPVLEREVMEDMRTAI